FFSKNGRPLYDQMGIIPDVLVPNYSNNYAMCNLNGSQLFTLMCELVKQYQKLLIENSTFESFQKNFPMKEAAKYIDSRLNEMSHKHFRSEKVVALLHRLIFYIQSDYYGMGTQTAETLKTDNLITEARRILSMEDQNAKRELAENSTK